MKKYNQGRGYHSAVRKRWSRKVWSAERSRILRGGEANPRRVKQGKLFWIRIDAPEQLDLMNVNLRGPTSDFLGQIRMHSRKKGVGLRINLSRMTMVRPMGAVMLLAEVHRAVAGMIGESIVILRPADSVVHAVMCQIGLYEDVEKYPEADREDVRHWRIASGVASEGAKGGEILQSVEGELADDLTTDLYAGIVEAMTNTVHHAYAGPVGAELKKHIGRRWWALSQKRDGELSIAICDLGIGIPRSLPRSSTFSNASVRAAWKALGLDRSDGNAIKVALELGRTSTGKEGRGRGLSEIVEAANLSEAGRVYISSNKGVFVSADGKSYAHDHSHSIRGTLIHWAVETSRGET